MVSRKKNPNSRLEKAIGYRFRKRSLLDTALIHRSFRFENGEVTSDNQRLEFLGDAVLSFVTAAYVYEKFVGKDEGFLTSLRSRITSGKALAKMARDICLGEYVKMGKGEERSGGRKRPSNLADALEAVVGAAFLDGGMKAVQKILKKLFVPQLDSLSDDVWAENPKGRLQEYSQRTWKKSPRYRVIRKVGPPHAIMFTAKVTLDGGIEGTGRGLNKQDAETKAAAHALSKLPEKRTGLKI